MNVRQSLICTDRGCLLSFPSISKMRAKPLELPQYINASEAGWWIRSAIRRCTSHNPQNYFTVQTNVHAREVMMQMHMNCGAATKSSDSMLAGARPANGALIELC